MDEKDIKIRDLVYALRRIEAWNELSFDYVMSWGSRGEQDYYRNIARDVLKKY